MKSQASVADKHLPLIINSIFIVIKESCYQGRFMGEGSGFFLGILNVERNLASRMSAHV